MEVGRSNTCKLGVRVEGVGVTTTGSLPTDEVLHCPLIPRSDFVPTGRVPVIIVIDGYVSGTDSLGSNVDLHASGIVNYIVLDCYVTPTSLYTGLSCVVDGIVCDQDACTTTSLLVGKNPAASVVYDI